MSGARAAHDPPIDAASRGTGRTAVRIRVNASTWSQSASYRCASHGLAGRGGVGAVAEPAVDVERRQHVALRLQGGKLVLVDGGLRDGEVRTVLPGKLVGPGERHLGLADHRKLDVADRDLEFAVAQQLQKAVLAVSDGLLVEDQEVLRRRHAGPGVHHVQVGQDPRLAPDRVLVEELLSLLEVILLHWVLLALVEEVERGILDVQDHREDRALEIEVRDPHTEPGVLDRRAVVVGAGPLVEGVQWLERLRLMFLNGF